MFASALIFIIGTIAPMMTNIGPMAPKHECVCVNDSYRASAPTCVVCVCVCVSVHAFVCM